ncbi:MAG: hypothetical protein AAF478_05535 [Pseudomonadota bacterium]
MTDGITPALNADALYTKSQLYIRRALLRKTSDEMDEYQLWASLSLELLGKSSLSSHHPSLIADPQHFQSLFAAAGINASTDIKTITAKTLYERLQHLIRPFDDKLKHFCNQMANRRNAELHSGEAPFQAIRLEAWEAEFWYATDVILQDMGSTLEEWLGSDDASLPKEILTNARQAKTQSVILRVERTQEEFQKQKKSVRELAIQKSHQKSIIDYPRLFSLLSGVEWEVNCPSCTSKAYIAGIQIEEVVVDTTEDQYAIWEIVERQYSGEQFHCPTCGLRLEGYDELQAAGVECDFAETDEREMEYEPEYGND